MSRYEESLEDEMLSSMMSGLSVTRKFVSGPISLSCFDDSDLVDIGFEPFPEFELADHVPCPTVAEVALGNEVSVRGGYYWDCPEVPFDYGVAPNLVGSAQPSQGEVLVIGEYVPAELALLSKTAASVSYYSPPAPFGNQTNKHKCPAHVQRVSGTYVDLLNKFGNKRFNTIMAYCSLAYFNASLGDLKLGDFLELWLKPHGRFYGSFLDPCACPSVRLVQRTYCWREGEFFITPYKAPPFDPPIATDPRFNTRRFNPGHDATTFVEPYFTLEMFYDAIADCDYMAGYTRSSRDPRVVIVALRTCINPIVIPCGQLPSFDKFKATTDKCLRLDYPSPISTEDLLRFDKHSVWCRESCAGDRGIAVFRGNMMHIVTEAGRAYKAGPCPDFGGFILEVIDSVDGFRLVNVLTTPSVVGASFVNRWNIFAEACRVFGSPIKSVRWLPISEMDCIHDDAIVQDLHACYGGKYVSSSTCAALYKSDGVIRMMTIEGEVLRGKRVLEHVAPATFRYIELLRKMAPLRIVKQYLYHLGQDMKPDVYLKRLLEYYDRWTPAEIAHIRANGYDLLLGESHSLYKSSFCRYE